MINVQCYACGAAHNVSDDKAGKKLKCRECGAVVRIPESDGITAELRMPGSPAKPPPQPVPQRTQRPSEESDFAPARGGSNTGLIIGLSIGGGVLVVAGIVVGILFAAGVFSSEEKKKRDGGSSSLGGNGRGGSMSAAERYEQVTKRLIDLLNRYAKAMSDARDQNSARKATVEINRLCQEMQKLGTQLQAIPPLTAEENRRLKGEYQRRTAAAFQRAILADRSRQVILRRDRDLLSASNCFGTALRRVFEIDKGRKDGQ